MERTALLLRKLRQVKRNEELPDEDEYITQKIVIGTKKISIETTNIPEALKSTTLSTLEMSQKQLEYMKHGINEVSKKMKSILFFLN